MCIDIAYNIFEREELHIARRRSLVVLTGFATAMLAAIVAPGVGFSLMCAALLLDLRPEQRARRQ